MAGIQRTLETVEGVKKLTVGAMVLGKEGYEVGVEAYAVLKSGNWILNLGKLFSLASKAQGVAVKSTTLIADAKELLKDAQAALPEVLDLDSAEGKQLAPVAIDALREIVLKGKEVLGV